MSLVEDLLTILTSYSGGYRLMRQRLRGFNNSSFQNNYQNLKDQTLRITLSRLKKRELIENQNKIWLITKKGQEYLKSKIGKEKRHIHYPSAVKNRKKNMIIVFDVPEAVRKKRNWLRVELSNLGFSLLQKSVWFGPAPLPEEFIKSLNKLNLLKFIKFFKATKKDLV